MADVDRTETASRDIRNIRADGNHWRVFEHKPQYDRRGRPTLVFDSDAVLRRVRNFPANWRELSDEELYAVSFGT